MKKKYYGVSLSRHYPVEDFARSSSPRVWFLPLHDNESLGLRKSRASLTSYTWPSAQMSSCHAPCVGIPYIFFLSLRFFSDFSSGTHEMKKILKNKNQTSRKPSVQNPRTELASFVLYMNTINKITGQLFPDRVKDFQFHKNPYILSPKNRKAFYVWRKKQPKSSPIKVGKLYKHPEYKKPSVYHFQNKSLEELAKAIAVKLQSVRLQGWHDSKVENYRDQLWIECLDHYEEWKYAGLSSTPVWQTYIEDIQYANHDDFSPEEDWHAKEYRTEVRRERRQRKKDVLRKKLRDGKLLGFRLANFSKKRTAWKQSSNIIDALATTGHLSEDYIEQPEPVPFTMA